MTKNLFISIDANETGKSLEKIIFAEDHAGLRAFSDKMKQMVYDLESYLKDRGASVYMAGGDNVLAEIPEDLIPEIIAYTRNLNQTQNMRFSVGVGRSAAQSYMALKYAKVNDIFGAKYFGESFEVLF